MNIFTFTLLILSFTFSLISAEKALKPEQYPFSFSKPLGKIDNARQIEMKFTEKEKKFDPKKVYKGQPNPTKI